MGIVHYRPNSILDALQKEFFSSSPFRGMEDDSTLATSAWAPKSDIKEEDSQFIVSIDIPGVALDDINVSMENNTLTIKGNREIEHKDSNKNFMRIEREFGEFHRQFALPRGINEAGISAKMKHGVLKILIPKQEETLGRNIQITAED